MPPTSYATPDARNTWIGSGEFWFDRFDASTNLASGQFRHAGLVTEALITPSHEVITIKNQMDGNKSTYDQATIGIGGKLTAKLSEAARENLALALAGTVAAFTQSSGTATLLAVPSTVKLGYALDTGKKQITVSAVQKAGGAALNANEFTMDSETGLITILSTATTVIAGDSITWTGTYPAIASFQIHGEAQPDITLACKFRSASNAKGPRGEWNVWRARVNSNQAIALITDAFGSLDLELEILVDGTKPAGQQLFNYREI